MKKNNNNYIKQSMPYLVLLFVILLFNKSIKIEKNQQKNEKTL